MNVSYFILMYVVVPVADQFQNEMAAVLAEKETQFQNEVRSNFQIKWTKSIFLLSQNVNLSD